MTMYDICYVGRNGDLEFTTVTADTTEEAASAAGAIVRKNSPGVEVFFMRDLHGHSITAEVV